MTHPFAAVWLSAILTAAAAAPLAAETPAPAAPNGETKSGDPRVDRQRNSAAKLAGMVRFVDASCPQAKPDYDRFRSVIAGLGVDIKDLETGALMAQSLSYTQVYQKDVAESCGKAVALFGASGTVLAGLVVPRTASDAPPPGMTPPGAVPPGATPTGTPPEGTPPAGKTP